MNVLAWAVQDVSVLGASIPDWMGVVLAYIIALASIAGFIWRLMIRPVETAIDNEKVDRVKDHNGLGERIAEIARSGQTVLGKVEILERNVDRSSQDRAAMHEHIGRLEQQVSVLADMLQRNEVNRLGELGDVRERLARIEAKFDLIHQSQRRDQSREGGKDG